MWFCSNTVIILFLEWCQDFGGYTTFVANDVDEEVGHYFVTFNSLITKVKLIIADAIP